MRLMSFALTTPQFRARTKSVTRRLGWRGAKPGDRVMGIEKGQGLKRGERVVRLGEIVLREVWREPLRDLLELPWLGEREVALEGFPGMTPEEFVAMFCKANDCTPDTEVTRIAFRYV